VVTAEDDRGSALTLTTQIVKIPRKSSRSDPYPKQEPPAGTSNDRLLWALPNFLTVENATAAPPLTTAEKFHVTFRTSFDYVDYGWYAFLAGLSQMDGSEPGYGPGAGGYVKRYGGAFADGTIENVMTSAVFPSLLGQDPRYYQLGKGGARHRTEYSVSRTFITRSDAGRRQFNFRRFSAVRWPQDCRTPITPAETAARKAG
jgi:hypothetical protein